MPRGLAHDHDEKRRSIRKGAARHFAALGFDRASMSATARACGISKALLYHYYASKEALLADILHSHLSDLEQVAASIHDPQPEPHLRRLIGAILMAYREADAEHKLQTDALATLPHDLKAPLITLQKSLITKMSHALSALRPDLSPDQLHPITMSVYGMLNWFYMWHRPGQLPTRQAYADLVCDLTLGGLAQLR